MIRRRIIDSQDALDRLDYFNDGFDTLKWLEKSLLNGDLGERHSRYQHCLDVIKQTLEHFRKCRK